MRSSKLATAALTVILALLVLSASIAVPILFRPFYYIQIDALRLPERTGWPEEVIREAYDEVLDFCVLGTPLWDRGAVLVGVGAEPLCRCPGALSGGLFSFGRHGCVCGVAPPPEAAAPAGVLPPSGRGPGFWAGVLAAGLVLAVGAWRRWTSPAFSVFHAVLFPGKDNWLFNPATDEIILIMPERFFLNCALLIGAVLLSACGALIAGDLLSAHRRTKKTVLPR